MKEDVKAQRIETLSALWVRSKHSRIIVIGFPGSGKSTFSRKLASLLHLKVIHLDALFWEKGHKPPNSYDDWLMKLRSIIGEDNWIMDGNYRTSLEIRTMNADTIFFFDLPIHVCLRNAISRTLKYYGTDRVGVTSGNSERFDRHFFIRVMRILLIYPVMERSETISFVRSLSKQKSVFFFHSQADVDDFLRSLSEYLLNVDRA